MAHILQDHGTPSARRRSAGPARTPGMGQSERTPAGRAVETYRRRKRVHPVDKMADDEVRLMLKEIVADARAAVRQGSSSDAGELVIDRLDKAGLIPPARRKK